jgi:hypothetical protein
VKADTISEEISNVLDPKSSENLFNDSTLEILNNSVELKKEKETLEYKKLSNSFANPKNPKLSENKITKRMNNVILSSHMMKQMKGGLPGQKVYKWDRLNEYKMFTKKMNDDISEIEVEENESILSRDSNYVLNKNIINKSYPEFGEKERDHFRKEIKGTRAGETFGETFNSMELDRRYIKDFKNKIEESKSNFRKKFKEPDTIKEKKLANLSQFSKKRSPNGKKTSKTGIELER